MGTGMRLRGREGKRGTGEGCGCEQRTKRCALRRVGEAAARCEATRYKCCESARYRRAGMCEAKTRRRGKGEGGRSRRRGAPRSWARRAGLRVGGGGDLSERVEFAEVGGERVRAWRRRGELARLREEERRDVHRDALLVEAHRQVGDDFCDHATRCVSGEGESGEGRARTHQREGDPGSSASRRRRTRSKRRRRALATWGDVCEGARSQLSSRSKKESARERGRRTPRPGGTRACTSPWCGRSRPRRRRPTSAHPRGPRLVAACARAGR